jgi:hypothetical protein
MADLTHDRNTQRKDGELQHFQVAQGAEIFAGSLVELNSDGYAQPAGDDSSVTFAGVADEHVDNSDGAAGDKTVKVWREHTWHFETVDPWSFDQGACNGWVYASDDQTVADDSDVSNNLHVGVVEEVESDGSVWINIEPATRKGFDWSPATTTTTAAPTTTT